jgi:hypothetical protein
MWNLLLAISARATCDTAHGWQCATVVNGTSGAAGSSHAWALGAAMAADSTDNDVWFVNQHDSFGVLGGVGWLGGSRFSCDDDVCSTFTTLVDDTPLAIERWTAGASTSPSVTIARQSDGNARAHVLATHDDHTCSGGDQNAILTESGALTHRLAPSLHRPMWPPTRIVTRNGRTPRCCGISGRTASWQGGPQRHWELRMSDTQVGSWAARGILQAA